MEMQRPDPPDAVLRHVLVLEHAAVDGRAPLAVAGQEEPVPAALRRSAVGREVHHGSVDQLCVHRAGREPLAGAALAGEERGDGRAAGHGLVADRQVAVVGKERRHLVPQPVLRVLRVGALQRLHGAHRLGPLDVARQRVGRRLRSRANRQQDARRCDHHASRHGRKNPPDLRRLK